MTALQHLNRLADEAKAQRYPNVPAHCRIKSKFDDKTANSLTACVIKWIKLNGQFAARINSTGIYDEKLKKFRPSGATKGVPDVVACIRGLFCGIEIKIGLDKLSYEQRDVAHQIESALGYFVEVHTFEEFYNWYEKITRPPFV